METSTNKQRPKPQITSLLDGATIRVAKHGSRRPKALPVATPALPAADQSFVPGTELLHAWQSGRRLARQKEALKAQRTGEGKLPASAASTAQAAGLKPKRGKAAQAAGIQTRKKRPTVLKRAILGQGKAGGQGEPAIEHVESPAPPAQQPVPRQPAERSYQPHHVMSTELDTAVLGLLAAARYFQLQARHGPVPAHGAARAAPSAHATATATVPMSKRDDSGLSTAGSAAAEELDDMQLDVPAFIPSAAPAATAAPSPKNSTRQAALVALGQAGGAARLPRAAAAGPPPRGGEPSSAHPKATNPVTMKISKGQAQWIVEGMRELRRDCGRGRVKLLVVAANVDATAPGTALDAAVVSLLKAAQEHAVPVLWVSSRRKLATALGHAGRARASAAGICQWAQLAPYLADVQAACTAAGIDLPPLG